MKLNWKKLWRALLALYGVYLSVTGIVHMTKGYAPRTYYRGVLMTPTVEILFGLCCVLAALFAPFSYGE